MDTSGEGAANVVLYLMVLAIFVNVAIRLVRLSPLPRRFPWVALGAVVLIGVPSLLQFAVPGLGQALARNPELTLEHGQWWRVLTAVAAQDGGPAAAAFNLVVVALAVAVGEWTWGRWRTALLFLLPSIALNLLAIAWDRPGGGSSFAGDGLMFSVLALGALVGARLLRVLCAAAVVIAAASILWLNDAHGVAMLLGAVLGLLFGPGLRRRWSPRRAVADYPAPPG